ncbi:glycine betaine ABC transporter substrate-binding protein [Paenibacillus lutrae]|uniref:Osmoprotectant ABC transporter substrate-binding protein n=1 Tax=Paenibacillus lutrae TaxID=2078573 RepID=A0A7X3FKV6_9BACL|nr:glycine betaine ABC transporter substrate-binding protein [Paenibacillus lutrae]MVP01482.1 osmoprotectant ABC transporter substrate-binding protein [Paenibacillus lutrae]
MKRVRRRILGTLLLASVVVSASGCGKGDTILIGTQTYSEPKIIAQMYRLLIEDRTDLKVDVLPDLASSAVIIDAMKKDDIQIATLYTGELLNEHFPLEEKVRSRDEFLADAQAGFDKYFNFKWFDPYGFENTYAFTVRKELADEKGWKKISDLKNDAGTIKLGVDTTWLERESDGYKAFAKHYDLKFGTTLPMEVALVYSAVASKEVDIVLAYSTDARLKEYDLVTLEDDKQFFPPYDGSPVVKKELLAKHPELNEIMELLIGKIDAKTMIDLNYEVDVKKRNEKKVAEDYLKKVGLLK